MPSLIVVMSSPKMQLCSPAKSEVTRVHTTGKTHTEHHHKVMWKKRMRGQVPARPPLGHMTLDKSLSFSGSTPLSNGSDDNNFPQLLSGFSHGLDVGFIGVWLSNCVRLFCDPMNCSPPGPRSMGFSRQEYWPGLLFPSPGDLSNPGIEPRSPALAGGVSTWEAQNSLETSHQCSL